MIDLKENYLIIGASNNKEKYGYKVFKDLVSNGYNAIPINPKEKIILNHKVYSDINLFEGNIDNIVFVTKPEITEVIIKSLQESKRKPNKIRLQPGSENKTIINFCKENNLNCISNSCIMIKRKEK